MKAFLLSLFLLTASLQTFAAEGEKHIFVAFSERLQRKISLIVPTDRSRSPELAISQEIDQYPWDQVLFTTDVSDARVFVEPKNRVQKAGNGFVAQLGGRGQIEFTFHGDGGCRVVSTFPEFNLPAGEIISMCTYFFSKGPRPGFSGSN